MTRDEIAELIQQKRDVFTEWWITRIEGPARDLWNDRSWWLRRSRWSSVWDTLAPDFSRARRKTRHYIDRQRVLHDLRDLKDDYPDIVSTVKPSRFVSRLIHLKLRVEKDIPDIAPVMEKLFREDWEIDERKDAFQSRDYSLVHPNTTTKIKASARIGYRADCEVIEHKKEKTVTETEYEVICEGEDELTGRLSGRD